MPGKIHVPVTVATNGFDKLQRQFGRLKSVAVGVTAALGGLAAAARAIDFTGAAIQGARDLERNYAGLESVFKGSTQQMKDFGESASEMGLSMNEAAKATTFIGSVLKQSGFSIQETAGLTEELVELGADLALTYGYDVQEALLGMTALFRGEYDPIEKFGVAMKQSEIDAEKAARGLDGLTGAAERFADQQIRVEFLMERAGDAMGAFERQSGNLTVQQMRLRAEFENLRDTVADDLLPPIADFTGGLREIVEDVGPDLESMFSDLAPVLDDLGQASLPVLQAAIEGVIEFSTLLIGFLEDAMDPSTELGESFQDLGVAFGNLVGDTEGMPTMEQNFEGLAIAVTQLNDSLTDIITTIDDVKDPFVNLFNDVGKAIEGSGLSEEGAGAIGIVATIGILATNLERISKVVKKIPKGGLIGLALFGFGAAGNEQNKQIERAREEIVAHEGALDDLYHQSTTNAEGYALLEAKTLKAMHAQGLLTDEYIRQNPEIADLADKIRNTAPAYNSFNNELTNGRIAANQLGRSDGLPTWLNAVKDRAAAARSEVMGFKDATLQVLQLELRDLMRFGAPQEEIDSLKASIAELTKDPTGDDPGPAATDFVAEFFDGIKEGIRKEAARSELEGLGLSNALIEQILGSQGFEEVVEKITDDGKELAEELQADFENTAAGIAEIAKQAEEAEKKAQKLKEKIKGFNDEIADLNKQIKDLELERETDIADATKQFEEFGDSVNVSVDALETYQRKIGQFESQTNSDLQRIEQQIMRAFDNKYLLEEAKDNLLEYARAELNTLAQIQRQRDELLTRRNAAADVIFGIADSVAAAGNITGLLQDVEDSVEEIEVTELFERMAKSADGLRDFKVTVERNFTDVVRNTVDKSKSLVSNFQAVIDRTRGFIDNLKILRELGLDPFLFNQLVESGAEAGGATAQALVEGGADTVNEVNMLQTELEAMGVELGEVTYETTKNSGEQFVSGLIDGIDSQLEELEEYSKAFSEDFSQTFADMFSANMETAFEQVTDAIRDEFQLLLDELNKDLRAVEDKRDELLGVGDYFVPPADTVFPGDPGYDNPEMLNLDLPQAELDFLNESGFFDASPETMSSQPTQQTVVHNNYYGSEPLDLYKSSKQNVVQQSTFQSSNGSISATLSGVGN